MSDLSNNSPEDKDKEDLDSKEKKESTFGRIDFSAFLNKKDLPGQGSGSNEDNKEVTAKDSGNDEDKEMPSITYFSPSVKKESDEQEPKDEKKEDSPSITYFSPSQENKDEKENDYSKSNNIIIVFNNALNTKCPCTGCLFRGLQL